MSELCVDCGGQIEQPERGRRRKRCTTCSPPYVPAPRKLPTPCAQCGAHTLRKYCSQRCIDLAKRIPCAGCGKPIYHGTTSLPSGSATCRACRSQRKAPNPTKTPCVDCAAPSYGVRCRKCRDLQQRIGGRTRSEALKLLQARRADRDRQAPGPYTETKRRHLLARWKKQGRTCVYCASAPVETVDHVLPLALGGSNYEGNLAPACQDCNRSKLDNLLSAWRYGIRMRKWRVAVEPRVPKPQVRRTRTLVQTEMRVCPVCSALHVRRKYCSEACCSEANARHARDRYRATNGLPVNPSEWTQPTRRIA